MKGSNFDPEIDVPQSNATKSRHDETDLKQFERNYYARYQLARLGRRRLGDMTDRGADKKTGIAWLFQPRLGINPRSAAAAW
jgi:hypothetical protein